MSQKEKAGELEPEGRPEATVPKRISKLVATSECAPIEINNTTEFEPLVVDDDIADNPNEDVVKGKKINPENLDKEVEKLTHTVTTPIRVQITEKRPFVRWAEKGKNGQNSVFRYINTPKTVIPRSLFGKTVLFPLDNIARSWPEHG